VTVPLLEDIDVIKSLQATIPVIPYVVKSYVGVSDEVKMYVAIELLFGSPYV
jgi:hypothetical protein